MRFTLYTKTICQAVIINRVILIIENFRCQYTCNKGKNSIYQFLLLKTVSSLQRLEKEIKAVQLFEHGRIVELQESGVSQHIVAD